MNCYNVTNVRNIGHIKKYSINKLMLPPSPLTLLLYNVHYVKLLHMYPMYLAY